MTTIPLRIRQQYHALMVVGLIALMFGSAPVVAASSAPFLWRLSVTEGHSHYLLGSVHMMPRSIYPLPEALERAFEDTEGLVLETDINALNTPELQRQVIRHGLAEQGLANEIEPELHVRLKRHLADSGLPAHVCDAFRAWLCALTLEVMSFQFAGMSPEAGIDQHFANLARSDEREIGWLEEPLEQLSLFFELDQHMSAEFLESALDDLSDPDRHPERMVQIWLDNDVPALENVIQDMHDQYPKAYDQLLAARNRNWASQLDRSLRVARPQLIVVGAGHLAGPDNLIDLLRTRGFVVEPVAGPGPSTPLITTRAGIRDGVQPDGSFTIKRP